jgi:hypothetical protein
MRTLQKAGKVTRYVEVVSTPASVRDDQITMASTSGVDVINMPFMAGES